MTIRAMIITANGTKTIKEFDELGLEQLQSVVGGLIQSVTLPKYGFDMYMNEEGKLLGLAHNPIATALWVDSYGNTDIIVGDVLITNGYDINDEQIKSLEDNEVSFLLHYDDRVVIVNEGNGLELKRVSTAEPVSR